jgi:hypothetical protein
VVVSGSGESWSFRFFIGWSMEDMAVEESGDSDSDAVVSLWYRLSFVYYKIRFSIIIIRVKKSVKGVC